MPAKHLKEITDTLDEAVNSFMDSIPAIQKQIANELDKLLKDLDLQGDTIKANVSNIRKIASFKDRIEQIFKKSDYADKVKEYISTFDTIVGIQNKYFTTISKEFTPNVLLDEIKNQSIDAAIESLTESGLNANLIQPIHDILFKNATTGGSYSELTGQIRDYITSNKDTVGALERYTRQITTDSLNQFSAQYTATVAHDLGMDWFMYNGAIIDTSRTWCIACRDRKYIHRSEFTKLLKGDFPEFEDLDGQIYDKTGLPQGMIDGTNETNLLIFRGGYNCNHHFIPVPESLVPESAKKNMLK